MKDPPPNNFPCPPNHIIPKAIQIMRNLKESDQLTRMVEYLEANGSPCEFFDGCELDSALSNPRTAVIFVGAINGDLTTAINTIERSAAPGQNVPILFYLQQPISDDDEEWLLTAVDDFVVEPLNLESLRLRIRRLQRKTSQKAIELEQTARSLGHKLGPYGFFGEAPAFVSVIEKIPRVAACNAAVLIMGDTGTGKEMCARAIHYLSARAERPFIPINCGSIPTELFENELFGHDQGAFTDARRLQRGLVAEAEGGTLLLDEVNSLAPLAQIKLLRFLQDQQYKPLGASYTKQANVRVIAASNQNMQQMVREGSFREDLYYRLNVINLWLPTLCERREDVMMLASHFLRSAAREYCRPVRGFSSDAVQKLTSYEWPGNVRELENAVRQAVVMSDRDLIRAHELGLTSNQMLAGSQRRESFKAAKGRVVRTFEREYLKELLSVCGGNISQAAREAKKDRRAFFALLKKHEISFKN